MKKVFSNDLIPDKYKKLIADILYSGNTTETVTLLKDYTKYTYLEVIGRGADGGVVSTKIPVSELQNGNSLNLVGTSFRDNQTTLCFWLSTLKAVNNTLVPQTSKWLYFTTASQGFGNGNYMSVIKVLGYK